MKKVVAWIMVACMVLGLTANVYASENSARVITVHRVEGDNVTVARGNGRSATPRVGQRLSRGNTITTGRDSYLYLQMDAISVLKMDQNSRVAVSATRRRLQLSVQSGSALVKADTQDQGTTLETRVGNVGLTVRGTLYTMSAAGAGNVEIVMLSGAGEVNGQPLPAGSQMSVSASGAAPAVGAIDVGALNLFTLVAIQDNMAYLMDAGVLETAVVEALPALIEARTTEAQAQRQVADAAIAAVQAQVAAAVVPMPGTPAAAPSAPSAPSAPAGGGGSRGGGSGFTGPRPTPSPTPPPTDECDDCTCDNDEIAPPSGYGTGTEEDPFVLLTQECINWMAAYMYCAERHFVLGADIEIEGVPATSLGELGGVFDGADYTITVDFSMTASAPYCPYEWEVTGPGAGAGLFGHIGIDAVVRDLNVDGNITVYPYLELFASFPEWYQELRSDYVHYRYFAFSIDAGGLTAFNMGLIENVTSLVNVTQAELYFYGYYMRTGGKYAGAVGGIAGINAGIIKDSYAGGDINGMVFVGGIAGVNSGFYAFDDEYEAYKFRRATVSNSATSSYVIGDQSVGGLVGENRFGVIADSSASGNVFGMGVRSQVGGLVGNNCFGGEIVNSFATGNVTTGASNGVGGIAGENSGKIEASHATGNISGNGSVGGLVGANSLGVIVNSFATGNVLGTGSRVGGLVGANLGGAISSSFATGHVTGSAAVGGLIGFSDGAQVPYDDTYTTQYATITNTYATGTVTRYAINLTEGGLGGLVGFNGAGSAISYSFASGAAFATVGATGGIAGLNTGEIRHSVALNPILSGATVSRIVGMNVGLSGGFGIGTLINNHARADMEFPASLLPFVPSLDDDYDNGSPVPPADNGDGTDDSDDTDDTDDNGGDYTLGYDSTNGICFHIGDLRYILEYLGWSAEYWDITGEMPILVQIYAPQSPSVPNAPASPAPYLVTFAIHIGEIPEVLCEYAEE
ncbi:MAG: FecR domain-containing protein [Defluviitaleaceae bacterium]|nr:FecR domain-containing protein [Defluviitaleaceae bacterium]MCL2261906.1 FecR domain-containing protein [Defluviitaleaceae bacterium]